MRARPVLWDDLPLKALPDWWERVDEGTKLQLLTEQTVRVCFAVKLTVVLLVADPAWQKYSFTALAVGYGLLALVALVQLIRIQMRVPQFGWTTQKVFHLLNAFVCILRCVVLALRDEVRPRPWVLCNVVHIGQLQRVLHYACVLRVVCVASARADIMGLCLCGSA